MNDREAISAADAPTTIGPYSHAVRHGAVLYCSGALPIDPQSGDRVDASLAAETEQCLRNLAVVCEAGGADLRQTLRATIYTTELGGFAEINDAYARFFPDDPPARAAVGVAALPKGVRVEIDAVVAIDR
jgi:2-iminobutanoate/2-iminopropanoate deaminase